jgi:hypothetical protein
MNERRINWARHPWGRALLHLSCLLRSGNLRFYLAGVCLQFLKLWLISLLLLSVAGCGPQAPAPPKGPGLVTQGNSTEAASTYADPALADLTRDLRRWIVKSKQRPASFEDLVAKAGLQPPAPPAGKKYAISPEMRVVLVDR